MAKQLRLFDPAKVDASPFGRNDELTAAIGNYNKSAGLPKYEQRNDRQASYLRGHAIRQEYQKAQAAPESPTIRKSYDAMREHVNQQYDYMTRPQDQGGLGISVEVTKEDPYPDRKAMGEDFAKRRAIKVMSTETTGGSAALSNEDNDKFRAVHDVFGHLATGSSFSRHGEETAFHTHKQMFPPEAHEAVTSELRGQNSYLNFGGGDFPDQSPGSKLIGMPSWTSTDKLPAPKSRAMRRVGEQGTLF